MADVFFRAATLTRQASDFAWGWGDPTQDFFDNTESRIQAYQYFQGEYFADTLPPLAPIFTDILSGLGASLKALDVIGFTAMTIEITCPKDGKFVFTDPDNSWQKKAAKATKYVAKAFKAADVASRFGYIELGEFATKYGGTTYFKLTKDCFTLGSLVFTLWDHNLPQTYERCADDKQRYEHRLKNGRLCMSFIVVVFKIGLDVTSCAAAPMFAYATVIRVAVDVVDYSYGLHKGYYSLPCLYA